MAPHSPRDIVVIGASAGGVEALRAILSSFPDDLKAAVMITLHRRPVPSQLVSVLDRSSSLKVLEPQDGERPKRGYVYVAPPDRHLLFGDGVLWLSRGPKQHHTRPAVDPMFESAARHYGRRVIGILLSGGSRDGVAGLIAIKHHGGLSLAQDPDEALIPSMPRNAVLLDHVDVVFRISQLRDILVRLLAGEPAPAVARSLV